MKLENLIDNPFVRQRSVLRKGIAALGEPVARLERLCSTREAYTVRPPVVVNSLPKSGTHLLLQITRALPSMRYRGRFIATRPSLTLRERKPSELVRRVRRVLPGETLGAHLYFFSELTEEMEKINALHLFIYRDPRDVITSEAFYLAEMNRWHRMHRHFSVITNYKARLELALNGLDGRYPEANARLLPYAGWINSPSTVAIKYEDLAGTHQSREIERIVSAWRVRGGRTAGVDALVAHIGTAIDPGKSHTYREGGFGKWRRGLTDAESDEITLRLQPSMAAFGYADT